MRRIPGSNEENNQKKIFSKILIKQNWCKVLGYSASIGSGCFILRNFNRKGVKE
jgi:hypothetical protein